MIMCLWPPQQDAKPRSSLMHCFPAALVAICTLKMGQNLMRCGGGWWGGDKAGKLFFFLTHCICRSLVKGINNTYMENSETSSQDRHLFHVTNLPKVLDSEVTILIQHNCTCYWYPRLHSLPALDWRHWPLASCLWGKSITECFTEWRSIWKGKC